MLNKRGILILGLHVATIAIGIGAFLGFYKKNNNVLRIIKFPHPILRITSNKIDNIDDHIQQLSNDIITTLRYRTMIDFFLKRSIPRGLAAPQVGVSERLIVCGLNGDIKVMINPEILEKKGEYLSNDDCLSVRKGSRKDIKRSAYIKLKYKSLDNKERILTAKNYDAAFLEHEIDHLNGVLNIDY